MANMSRGQYMVQLALQQQNTVISNAHENVENDDLSDAYDDSLHDPDFQPDKNHDQSSDDELDIDHEEVVTDEPSTKRKTGLDISQRKAAKRLRMEGKQYKGMKKENGKWTFNVERSERILVPRSCSKRCDRSNVKQCRRISDTDRKDIFDNFWQNMTWEERKVYVNGLVGTQEVNQRTAEESRRTNSHRYYLKTKEERISVCKNMFLSTLGIGEKSVYAWLDGSASGIPNKRSDKGERKRAIAERHAGIRNSVENYLNALPKMESHYCRASSTKLYLEPVFDTFNALYNEYKTHCGPDGEVASRRLFRETFDSLNISLYKPKKDRCDTCCSFEAGNLSVELYDIHVQKKNLAKKEKDKDKEIAANDESIMAITLDLQAVLLSPKLNASALYYKTKLACHNFTMFDLTSKDVSCYFWHEGQGDLSANSFASCLSHYLEACFEQRPQVKQVIIFSDGCTYQNRNAILSNTLCHLSVKHGITITQKFLEKGHTYMEVDSVHSTIERKVKNKNIYVPQNYVDIMETVRPTQKYKVNYVDHSFFKKWSDLDMFSSIRPGTKVGDPVVTDLRALLYMPTGEIKYKLSFSEEFSDLPRRSKNSDPKGTVIQNLHTGPLKIKQSKYNHLMDLKQVIPADYHVFYSTLCHE